MRVVTSQPNMPVVVLWNGAVVRFPNIGLLGVCERMWANAGYRQWVKRDYSW
jgi:hypothetical protein